MHYRTHRLAALGADQPAQPSSAFVTFGTVAVLGAVGLLLWVAWDTRGIPLNVPISEAPRRRRRRRA